MFLLISNVLGRVAGPRGGPLMIMKDSLFLLISNALGKERAAGEGGPVMMMKDFWFLLISNVLGWGGGPLMMMEDFLLRPISNVSIRNQESNCFSWWNCGLFQGFVGSKIKEFFLYPSNTKINDLFLPGGPTDYLLTMLLLLSNDG